MGEFVGIMDVYMYMYEEVYVYMNFLAHEGIFRGSRMRLR